MLSDFLKELIENYIIKGKIDEIFSVNFGQLDKMKGLVNFKEILLEDFLNMKREKFKEIPKKFLENIKKLDSEKRSNKDLYNNLKQAIIEDSEEEIKSMKSNKFQNELRKMNSEIENLKKSMQDFKNYFEILEKSEISVDKFNYYCSRAYTIFKKYEENKLFKREEKVFNLTILL